MNFATKEPTVFNIDSILSQQKINLGNNNFKSEKKKNNDNNQDYKSLLDSKEEIENENLSVGSKEIHRLSVQRLENNVVKTKISCMDFKQVLNGDRNLVDNIVKVNEDKNNLLNNNKKNAYNQSLNYSKDQNHKDDVNNNNDEKIDELQPQLLELQKDVINSFFRHCNFVFMNKR